MLAPILDVDLLRLIEVRGRERNKQASCVCFLDKEGKNLTLLRKIHSRFLAVRAQSICFDLGRGFSRSALLDWQTDLDLARQAAWRRHALKLKFIGAACNRRRAPFIMLPAERTERQFDGSARVMNNVESQWFPVASNRGAPDERTDAFICWVNKWRRRNIRSVGVGDVEAFRHE